MTKDFFCYFFLIIPLVESIIILWATEKSDNNDGLAVFNPLRNYRCWTKMNWFGVGLFTLILNFLCPVLSVGYWFYKLCTVGRK